MVSQIVLQFWCKKKLLLEIFLFFLNQIQNLRLSFRNTLQTAVSQPEVEFCPCVQINENSNFINRTIYSQLGRFFWNLKELFFRK
jgi:hypothetical protein